MKVRHCSSNYVVFHCHSDSWSDSIISHFANLYSQRDFQNTTELLFVSCYKVFHYFLLSLDVLSKFTLKLSKYSVVNPQVNQRWKRSTKSEVGIDSHLTIFLTYILM